jgi:hypothetical protein
MSYRPSTRWMTKAKVGLGPALSRLILLALRLLKRSTRLLGQSSLPSRSPPGPLAEGNACQVRCYYAVSGNNRDFPATHLPASSGSQKLLQQEHLTRAKLRSTFPSWFVVCKPRRSRRSALSKIDPQCSIVLLGLLVYIQVCCILVRGHNQSSLASLSTCSTLLKIPHKVLCQRECCPIQASFSTGTWIERLDMTTSIYCY